MTILKTKEKDVSYFKEKILKLFKNSTKNGFIKYIDFTDKLPYGLEKEEKIEITIYVSNPKINFQQAKEIVKKLDQLRIDMRKENLSLYYKLWSSKGVDAYM